ncbi:hypothetical protein Pla8534_37480 [Lignipirellula cremea]|uniref:N-acetyltransferase domain-containing protein n=1 Tax=Lignipirellula cremea TaxID=2528010 RepID=A0A518DVS1_9BACT|nr:hypothetical protein Pla8534_37480 [Lignipirellula cremea]
MRQGWEMRNDSAPFEIPVRDRIRLTALYEEDQTCLVGLLNNPAISRNTSRIPDPYTLADAQDFIGLAATASARHGHPVHFAVRSTAGPLMGVCSLEGLACFHRAEIGYWLGQPY